MCGGSPEGQVLLEHDAPQDGLHLGDAGADGLGRHHVHEARGEEHEEHGQDGPGGELQVDVGHEVLHQPQPRLQGWGVG